ncbi:deoxyribonuclease V [Patescibacteria group bacterium]|nr:deoxyribonuclease V [Patescibacteria group bacterium]
MSEFTHAWNISPKEAIEIQRQMQNHIRLESLQKKITLIAGCDISMNLYSTTFYGGFVVLRYPELTLVDQAFVKDTVTFPYIPGLLSFREIPSLLKAWEKLKTKPDLIAVDGVGIAHPRRIGIASHLGVVLDIPTIGCAKSVLTGVYEEPDQEPGSYSFMHDPSHPEELLGAAIRSKRNVKPIFVSPGHKITLRESIDIIKNCVRKHRIPEPTRFAHNVMNEYRKQDLR